MELLFQIILIIHIIAGSLGLLTGTINILQKKGGKRHRQIGRLFVFFMVTAGISSIILAILHPNNFNSLLEFSQSTWLVLAIGICDYA
ncbi:MAG: putative membrane protein [Salibacteraceae bacterium]|jgi:uncharacterized membrane protein